MIKINKVLLVRTNRVRIMKWLIVLLIGFWASEIQTVVFCADIIVNSTTKVNLPAVGTAGRLYRVTDNERGLWMDQGSQWFTLSGGVINVKEFGAVGDNSADDTTAIQNAISALPSTGGTIFFPPGDYKVTQSLSITSKNHVRLLGTGMSSQGAGVLGASRIRSSGTGSVLTISGIQDLIIRDLTIRGDNVNTTIGLDITDAQYNTLIENVYVLGMSSHGIRMTNCWSFMLQHVRSTDNGGDGIRLLGVTSATLLGISTGNNGGHGLYIGDKTGAGVLGSEGIFIGGGAHGDANIGAGVYIDSAYGVTISGAFFENNGDYNIKAMGGGQLGVRGLCVSGDFMGVISKGNILLNNAQGSYIVGNRFSHDTGASEHIELTSNARFNTIARNSYSTGITTFIDNSDGSNSLDEGGEAGIIYFTEQNVPATKNEAPIALMGGDTTNRERFDPLLNGEVTGISVITGTGVITAGSYSIKIYVEGIQVGPTLTLSTGSAGRKKFTIRQLPFNAGQRIQVKTSSSALSPTTLDFVVAVHIRYNQF